MEYFLGSIVTAMSIGIVVIYFRINRVSKVIKPLVTQSKAFESALKIFRTDVLGKDLISQATKHQQSLTKQIALHEDMAYWIDNNVFYKALVSEEGAIQVETTQKVDTINADSKELELLTHIVEKLTEGNK